MRQFEPHGPPQSTSVSPPFSKPSPHAGSLHSLVQSSVLLALPSSQGSSPFCTPSPQRGAAQALLKHTPLSQSAARTQVSPTAHGVHTPPQSRSLSSPFSTPSPHSSSGLGFCDTEPHPAATQTIRARA